MFYNIEKSKEYAAALSTCTISNMQLYVDARFQNDLQEIAEYLRDALYGYKIPHYRVCGIKVVGAETGIGTVLSRLNGTNVSYHDLLIRCKSLIFSDVPPAGEYKYIKEKGISLSNDYGMLVGMGKVGTGEDDDTLYVPETGSYIESLVPDIHICNTDTSTQVYLLVKRGTGIVEFAENQGEKRLKGFVPARSIYELDSLVTINNVQDDKCIHLAYTKFLNESVLQEIINRFGLENC